MSYRSAGNRTKPREKAASSGIHEASLTFEDGSETKELKNYYERVDGWIQTGDDQLDSHGSVNDIILSAPEWFNIASVGSIEEYSDNHIYIDCEAYGRNLAGELQPHIIVNPPGDEDQVFSGVEATDGPNEWETYRLQVSAEQFKAWYEDHHGAIDTLDGIGVAYTNDGTRDWAIRETTILGWRTDPNLVRTEVITDAPESLDEIEAARLLFDYEKTETSDAIHDGDGNLSVEVVNVSGLPDHERIFTTDAESGTVVVEVLEYIEERGLGDVAFNFTIGAGSAYEISNMRIEWEFNPPELPGSTPVIDVTAEEGNHNGQPYRLDLEEHAVVVSEADDRGCFERYYVVLELKQGDEITDVDDRSVQPGDDITVECRINTITDDVEQMSNPPLPAVEDGETTEVSSAQFEVTSNDSAETGTRTDPPQPATEPETAPSDQDDTSSAEVTILSPELFDNFNRGSIVPIELEYTETDTGSITVGDADEQNVQIDVEVRDVNGTGSVTVYLNTLQIGDPRRNHGVFTRDSGTRIISVDSFSEQELAGGSQGDGVVPDGLYELHSVAGEKPANEDPDDLVAIRLDPRDTEPVNLWTAPGDEFSMPEQVHEINHGIEQGIIQPAVGEIAVGDYFILELKSTGLDGLLHEAALRSNEIDNPTAFMDRADDHLVSDEFFVTHTVRDDGEIGQPAVSADGDTISPGGQATVTVTAEYVDSISIDQLWTDWDVDSDVPDEVIDDSDPEDGTIELSWGTVQSTVTPELTLDPPTRYVGGEYVVEITASNHHGETVTTTTTVSIE